MARRAPPTRNRALPGQLSRPQRGAGLLSEEAWVEIAGSLKLSPREQQLIRAVFNNLTESAVAENLSISPHTVHSHMNRLFKKLQVTTRAQMVLCVMQELLLLTKTDGTGLPPVCCHLSQGRCPLLPTSAVAGSGSTPRRTGNHSGPA